MKLRDLEGSSQEIHDFFQNNGLKAEDYFIVPPKPVQLRWVAIPSILVLIGLSCLALEVPGDVKHRKLAFIITCFFSLWLAIVLQIKFKNNWATSVAVVGCLLLSLVAFGVFTPEQMMDNVLLFKQGK